MPSLSILIPTAGRPELRNCLKSIAFQIEPGDEVVIVGDVLDGPLPHIQTMVEDFGFRYVEYRDTKHTWGHSQLNFGMMHAKGDFLNFIDDDDVYVPGSLSRIHAVLDTHSHPLYLFRFLWYEGFLCWLQQGLFAEGYVGGHCIVAPNNPDKLGCWGELYTGDWDFVRDTVNLYGGPDRVGWINECIAVARPTPVVLAEIETFSKAVYA